MRYESTVGQQGGAGMNPQWASLGLPAWIHSGPAGGCRQTQEQGAVKRFMHLQGSVAALHLLYADPKQAIWKKADPVKLFATKNIESVFDI